MASPHRCAKRPCRMRPRSGSRSTSAVIDKWLPRENAVAAPTKVITTTRNTENSSVNANEMLVK